MLVDFGGDRGVARGFLGERSFFARGFDAEGM